MRYARDFNGYIIDARINKRHGNYYCCLCHNLCHWRKESIDHKSPHFYHAEANEDCILSVMGGNWNKTEDDLITFKSDSDEIEHVFPRKIVPDLRKIPSNLITTSEPEHKISRATVTIRLSSSDSSQVDFTLSQFCDLIQKPKEKFVFFAIPLPTRISQANVKEDSSQRIHRRLIRIIDSTHDLIEKLSRLDISDSVELSINLT